MRAAPTLAALAIVITACSPGPKSPEPPAGFPNLADFTAVNPNDPRSTLPSFRTEQQVSCVVGFGPQRSIVCSGDMPGLPASLGAKGCPSVRKADSSADSPCIVERSGPECGSARAMPIPTDQKVVGDNGTCAVGDGMAACIDADFKHGFVLKSTGRWVF